MVAEYGTCRTDGSTSRNQDVHSGCRWTNQARREMMKSKIGPNDQGLGIEYIISGRPVKRHSLQWCWIEIAAVASVTDAPALYASCHVD